MFEVKKQGIGARVQGIERKISYCEIRSKGGWKIFAISGFFGVGYLRI